MSRARLLSYTGRFYHYKTALQIGGFVNKIKFGLRMCVPIFFLCEITLHRIFPFRTVSGGWCPWCQGSQSFCGECEVASCISIYCTPNIEIPTRYLLPTCPSYRADVAPILRPDRNKKVLAPETGTCLFGCVRNEMYEFNDSHTLQYTPTS